MSTSDPFFKIRPTKRSNPESRTTLDSIHHSHVEKLQEELCSVEEIEGQIQLLKDEHRNTSSDMEKIRIERDIRDLRVKIDDIRNKKQLYTYFLDTGNILFDYYDMQEKISKGIESRQSTQGKSKPGSIWAALEEAAEKDSEKPIQVVNVDKKENLSRNVLLYKYLQKVDPEHAKETSVQSQLQDKYGVCDECQHEMIFSANEAVFTCANCGNHWKWLFRL